jgi:hypothetical protein
MRSLGKHSGGQNGEGEVTLPEDIFAHMISVVKPSLSLSMRLRSVNKVCDERLSGEVREVMLMMEGYCCEMEGCYEYARTIEGMEGVREDPLTNLFIDNRHLEEVITPHTLMLARYALEDTLTRSWYHMRVSKVEGKEVRVTTPLKVRRFFLLMLRYISLISTSRDEPLVIQSLKCLHPHLLSLTEQESSLLNGLHWIIWRCRTVRKFIGELLGGSPLPPTEDDIELCCLAKHMMVSDNLFSCKRPTILRVSVEGHSVDVVMDDHVKVGVVWKKTLIAS